MDKKNIIVIMTDEQRHDSLSFMGNPTVKTPNLDSIAEEGSVFENAFCASTLCVPSRACFFTGQYVNRNLAVSNAPKSHICPEQTSLVEILKDNGYKIGLAGKNHTFDDAYMDKFFDYREEYFHFGKTHGTFTEQDKRIVEFFKDKSIEGLLDGPAPFPEEDWINNRIAQDGIRFVDECRKQPFFLYFSFPDPHWPNIACEPYSSMYDVEDIEDMEALEIDWSSHPFKHFVQSQVNGFDKYSIEERKRILGAYYSQISSVDSAIGRLLKKIKEMELEDETIIIFTADHGNFAGRYGMIGKTGGFFDALVRIPLIFKIPGRKGVKRITADVSNIDVLPSLLAYLGIDIPETVQGKSLMPLLDGTKEFHRTEIFAEVGTPKRPLEPVDPDDFQELNRRMSKERGWHWFCDYVSNGRSVMIRKEGWKYCYYVGDKEELYDLSTDPYEEINLAGLIEYSEKKDEMKKRLIDWILSAPFS